MQCQLIQLKHIFKYILDQTKNQSKENVFCFILPCSVIYKRLKLN